MSLRTMKKEEKKAVSPVVTTVLLIMIVIILAIIILLWSRGFIKERILKFDKPIDRVCSEVQIQPYVNADKTIGFTNTGNVPIYAVDLQVSESGNSYVNRLGISDGGKVDIGLTTIFSDSYKYEDTYEEVKIIPVLLGKTKSGAVKAQACPENLGVIV